MLLCLLLGVQSAARPVALPSDTVRASGPPMARFEAARALAVDLAGLLYVVDAGRDVVDVLTPGGVRRATLGGPGTGAGRFDTPADIAPTNGLVLVVADAGNGRIQRFSRDFLHLASVPIGRDEDVTRFGRDPGEALGEGRPVAVAVGTTNEAFAVDAARGVVVKWDAAGRFERTIGGYEAGAGALSEPVALALDARGNLYVADRGRAALVVYDRFGGYERALVEGHASDVRAVTLGGGAIWVVLPHRLLVFDLQGRLVRTVEVRLPEPLVDVAVVGETLYLLTAEHLYVGDERGPNAERPTP